MSNLPPTAQLSQVILVEAFLRHTKDPLTMSPELKPGPQRIRIEINATPFTDEGAMGIRVTVVTDPTDDAALYNFGVTMAAILTRTTATPAEWAERQFTEIATTMLYPFIREVVANLTGRGRFGPVWLNPFNVHEFFEQLDEKPEAETAPAT